MLLRDKRTIVGEVCFRMYRWRVFRPLVLFLLNRVEGGIMFSETWRRIALEYYKIRFGKYSYGVKLKPGSLPQGTVVGRFCSIACGLTALRRNHPSNGLSCHPLFSNKAVGLLEKDTFQVLLITLFISEMMFGLDKA